MIGECNTKWKECKNDSSQKGCKKKKKICKKECDAATLWAPPPVCKDNDISGFGTAWCKSNAQSVTFCMRERRWPEKVQEDLQSLRLL